MTLRDTATADLAAIMADKDTAFGRDITLTDPTGTPAPVVGRSGDIGQVLDPETGVPVSGRLPHIAITTASLDAAGLGYPMESDPPWTVSFVHADGEVGTFAITEVLPDRTVGCLVCFLGVYE